MYKYTIILVSKQVIYTLLYHLCTNYRLMYTQCTQHGYMYINDKIVHI